MTTHCNEEYLGRAQSTEDATSGRRSDAKGQLSGPQGRTAIKPCIGFAQASAGMLYSSVMHRRRMVDDLAWVAKKDVASCEKPRGGARIL